MSDRRLNVVDSEQRLFVRGDGDEVGVRVRGGETISVFLLRRLDVSGGGGRGGGGEREMD